MRYTVHELHIDFMPNGAASFHCFLRFCFCLIQRNFTRDSFIQQFFRFADAICYMAGNNGFAVETIHRYLCICRNDDAVSCCNFFFSQYILCTAAAAGFYFDGAVLCFCCFFQTFRSHVCVSDACGAGSNCQNFANRLCSCFCGSFFCFFFAFRFFRVVDDFQEFIHCFCVSQTIRKVFIHHHNGKFAQYIQMHIIRCIRSSDQENQCCRFSVQRFKINAFWYNQCSQTRFFYEFAFPMRNCQSFANACCSFFFSAVNLFAVSLRIFDFTTVDHQLNNCVQSFFLGRRFCIKGNTAAIQQICNTHVGPLPLF